MISMTSFDENDYAYKITKLNNTKWRHLSASYCFDREEHKSLELSLIQLKETIVMLKKKSPFPWFTFSPSAC
jgi:hypothetical protein